MKSPNKSPGPVFLAVHLEVLVAQPEVLAVVPGVLAAVLEF